MNQAYLDKMHQDCTKIITNVLYKMPTYTTSVLGTAPLKMSTRAKTPISLFTCLHDNFLQVHFYNKHRAHTVPNRKRHLYLLFTTVFFLSLRSLSGPVIRASLCHGISTTIKGSTFGLVDTNASNF